MAFDGVTQPPAPLVAPAIGPDEAARVVVLPSGALAYVLRRSPRARGLRVTIDPDRGVVATVPLSRRRGWAHPEPVVDAFLAQREPWLRRHLATLGAARSDLAARGGLADGAAIRFRGELHRLTLRGGDPTRASVERLVDGDRPHLLVTVGRGPRGGVADALETWFRLRARAAIDQAVADHAPAMGVAPGTVVLRDPRTRWGSASREGRLMLSWRLVLAPPGALETVVVHELAHLREFGHGPRFWALVAGRVPDHRTWRRWLKAHAFELHRALDTA